MTVVEQQEVTSLGYSLFAMWLSSSLELQLAAQVRALHEPADVEDQLQRQQVTWNALVRSFVFDKQLNSPTAAAAPQTGDPGDRRLAALGSRPDATPRHNSEERNVASDGLGDGRLAAFPTAAPRRDLLIADLVMSVVVRSGEFSVEEVLLDELTVVQELASWQEPLTSVGLWSPQNLADQQTELEGLDVVEVHGAVRRQAREVHPRVGQSGLPARGARSSAGQLGVEEGARAAHGPLPLLPGERLDPEAVGEDAPQF